jgi:acetyl-CoA carboxylase biotin carboxyl carrier protein
LSADEWNSKARETSVADEDQKAPGPFDVNTVRALVTLMSRHGLSEIDLRRGDQRICLRRGPLKTTVNTLPSLPASPTLLAAENAGRPAESALADAFVNTPPAPTKKLIEIKSPTPGTFYSRSSPEADVFVKEGSRVEPTTVVCLIEAMKLYTEIQAECSGIIREILVENAQPVEFDQVLFRVDPQ